MQTSLVKKDSENKHFRKQSRPRHRHRQVIKGFSSFKTNKSGLNKPRLETGFQRSQSGGSLETNLNFP